MLPTRGIRSSSQALNTSRRRFDCLYAKSFSTSRSVPRATSLTSGHGALSSRASSRPQILRAGIVLPLLTARRYASTNPISTNQTSLPETTQLSDDLLNSTSILDQPETIGYLQSLGLDYGYGPTSMVSWVLEHIHVYGGTPWWASIALTAVLFRIVMFKPYIDAADNSARMMAIQPIMKPLQAKMTELMRTGDQVGHMMARKELQMISSRAGVKLWKGFVPMVQVFFGYGTFVLLRAMGNLPVPGLETGGILWFQNLAVMDPTYLLPLMTAGIMHIVLKKGGETGVNTMSNSVVKALAYGLPCVTFIFTSWLPAGLQISFLVSGILAGAQSTLFRNAKFREAMGMYPMPTNVRSAFEKPQGPPNPFQDRIIVAKPDSYRASQTPSYQAPRQSQASKPTNIYGTAPEVKEAGGILGRLSSMKNNAAETMADARKNMVETVTNAVGNNTKDGKRGKAELKKLAAYEENAQAEEKRKLHEMDRERRKNRQARKGNKTSR